MPKKVKLPQDWNMTLLKRLYSESPKNGLYKSMNFYGSGVPIIRINDYNLDGNISYKDLLRVILEETEIESYELKDNDILINRVNSLSHIGKVVIISNLLENTVFESNMIRLRFNETIILPKYVFYYLSSEIGRRQCWIDWLPL